MSNDFFRVKKGLNIKPQDPSGLTDLQDGDIIVDSTDDNRLKVYDSVGGDFASVGTGGSSGNILKDIEKLTPVVSNVVAVTDTVTFLPIDDNNKSVKATFSGSDGSIRYEAAASADLDGVQGVVIVWIKTTLDNLTLTATKDGVAQNNGLSINSTNKWRQYKIPVVLGDASYGFQITASGAVAGDIFIDEAFVKVEKQETQLGQTKSLGHIRITNSSCSVSSSSGSYNNLIDADCIPDSNNTGAIEMASGGKIGVSFNATAGLKYEVNIGGAFYANNATECFFAIAESETNTNIVGHRVSAGSYNTFENGLSNMNGSFVFETSGVKEFFVRTARVTGSGGVCSAIASTTFPMNLSVTEYSNATSTIASQDTELTAKTANELSANISNNGTATIDSFNYDFIDTVNRSSAGTVDFTFKSGIFSEPPSVVALKNQVSSGYTTEISGITSSGFTVITKLIGTDTAADRDFSVQVSKQGTDVNKSQTIVGKFEQIEEVTADLTAAEANEFSATISSTGVVSNENFNFIDGDCAVTGTGIYECSLLPGIFSSTPNCVANTRARANQASHSYNLSSNSLLLFGTASNNGVAAAYDFTINCMKSTDYNKSFKGAVIKSSDSAQEIADIVRTDIVSTALCQVDGIGSSGGAYTALTPIPYTEVSDNCNAFNGTTFTAQKDGLIILNGGFQFTVNTNGTPLLFKNGVQYKNGGSQSDSTTSRYNFTFTDNATAGDTYFIAFSNSGTLQTSSENMHLNITELPDNASVLESLNQNPRLQLDQYSETEIEWGRWNGQQLYRRCFTLSSNVSTTGSTIDTWDTNLNLVNSNKFTSTDYFIPIGVYSGEGTSAAFSYCQYNTTNGRVTCNAQGVTMYAGTTACVDYTK